MGGESGVFYLGSEGDWRLLLLMLRVLENGVGYKTAGVFVAQYAANKCRSVTGKILILEAVQPCRESADPNPNVQC